MHPDFHQLTLHEHAKELERGLRAAYLTRTVTPTPAESEELVLRLCTVHDDAALDRLAILDGKPLPAWPSRGRRGQRGRRRGEARRGRRVDRRPVPADGAPPAAARAARTAARARRARSPAPAPGSAARNPSVEARIRRHVRAPHVRSPAARDQRRRGAEGADGRAGGGVRRRSGTRTSRTYIQSGNVVFSSSEGGAYDRRRPSRRRSRSGSGSRSG